MTIFLIFLIVFFATLVRAVFGFGTALIAVPLLSLLIPLDVVVPLCTLASILIASVMIVQDHSDIHVGSAMWLLVFGFMGIPVGLMILIHADDNIVKPILGLLVILYSIYSLVAHGGYHLKSDNKIWLFLCGFTSGICGGAYGLNGPPLIVYGNMRRWTARNFKATLQAYFLPASIISMFGYWYSGLWSSTVSYYFLISLPAMIPALIFGRHLNHRIQDASFLKFVYVGLIITGGMLIVESFL